MNILFIDIETTGVDPQKHEIIQIAAHLHKNGEVVDKFVTKVSHDDPVIDLAALKVNGASPLSLGSYGNPLKLSLNHFAEFLLQCHKIHGSFVVCGHNVNFDLAFIKQAYRKVGMEGVESILPFRALDTAAIGLFLNSVGALKTEGKYGLDALLKALEIVPEEKDQRHEAESDVRLTAKALYKMQDLIKGSAV